jgi:hypothetical protein
MFCALGGMKDGACGVNALGGLGQCSQHLVCSRSLQTHVLIMPAPTTATPLFAVPSSATPSISRIESAHCGRSKWLLHWNGELLDWWLVLYGWRWGYVGV